VVAVVSAPLNVLLGRVRTGPVVSQEGDEVLKTKSSLNVKMLKAKQMAVGHLSESHLAEHHFADT
jgi:hypothetical protein